MVTQDRESKASIANPVLCKGRTFEDTVGQSVLNIRRFGHQGKVIRKTGNAATLVDLRMGVAEKLGMGPEGGGRAAGSGPRPWGGPPPAALRQQLRGNWNLPADRHWQSQTPHGGTAVGAGEVARWSVHALQGLRGCRPRGPDGQ